MRMPCSHDLYDQHAILVNNMPGTSRGWCPGGREATAADLVAELRRLDAIDYKAAIEFARYGPLSDTYKPEGVEIATRAIVDAALPEGETK